MPMTHGYELNEDGTLYWVDVPVAQVGRNLIFISPIDGSAYEIPHATTEQLEGDFMRNDYLSDQLATLVGEMGGGLWNDEPDGSEIIYNYDPNYRLLTITEKA